MKIINSETIDLEIIANKIDSPYNWCMSCQKPFRINEKKIKWRTKIDDYNYAIWKIQCNVCAINTMSTFANQLNRILQGNVIEVNTIGN